MGLQPHTDMGKPTAKTWRIRFITSGSMAFLIFCGLVMLGRYMIFSPHDIRGRTDFLEFRIAAQGKDNPKQIVFCSFHPGPAREISLDGLRRDCAYGSRDPFPLGQLTMSSLHGLVPLLEEEPDYGWTRYEVLSSADDSQLIETETYFNSDGLVTRYRVRGTFIEPVAQINVLRGLHQMFVVFYLPLALLLAWVLALLIQFLVWRMRQT